MAQVDFMKDFKTLHEFHKELLDYLTLKLANAGSPNFESKVRFEYELYLQRLAALAECDPEAHCPDGRCPPCGPDLAGLTKRYLSRLKKYNLAAAAKKKESRATGPCSKVAAAR